MIPPDYASLSLVSNDIELRELRSKIAELESKESDIGSLLGEIDKSFAMRRAHFQEEKERIFHEKARLKRELARLMTPLSPYPPAPGPPELAFVDSGWFTIVSNLVVVCNLLCMSLEFTFPTYRPFLYVCEQLFLVLYTLELVVKWKFHRCNLFCGSIFVVWWNWLDASIVVCGIVDQWLMLLVKDFIPFRLPRPLSTSLKMLRLFRILRFLKVLKPFVQGDLSWTEEAPFQLFMSAVIAVNSVVMALELDYDWGWWFCFEQAFLIIYCFELCVRLKGFGCKFFTNKDLIWNNLDFIMVCGGVFNLWLMPAWSLIQTLLNGSPGEESTAVNSLIKILRMAKILRVLRLVRLLRMVKPLYSLLVGVMEALDAMKWVMILTLLILYAGAIVFTSLIGHAYIYSNLSDVPPEAEIYFGTVPQSVFSLFKLMNGDISVVEPITKDIKGRLLFISFMILSNWAVLAILTSVVSEHMITSSQKLHEMEKQEEEEMAFYARTGQLAQFFVEMDDDGDGKISESEWQRMLAKPVSKQHLCDLTGLDGKTLNEIFYCISEERNEGDESSKRHNNSSEQYLRCSDFIEHLEHDKDSVDRRQIMHLRYWLEKTMLTRMQDLENSLHVEFNELRDTVNKAMRLSKSDNLNESELSPKQEATATPNLADVGRNSRTVQFSTSDKQETEKHPEISTKLNKQSTRSLELQQLLHESSPVHRREDHRESLGNCVERYKL